MADNFACEVAIAMGAEPVDGALYAYLPTHHEREGVRDLAAYP